MTTFAKSKISSVHEGFSKFSQSTFSYPFKLLTGKTIWLDLRPTDSVYDIKLKLSKEIQVPPERLAILLSLRQLKDDELVKNLQLQKYKYAHAIVKSPKKSQDQKSTKNSEKTVVKIESHSPSDISRLSASKPVATRVAKELRQLTDRGYVFKVNPSNVDIFTKRDRITIQYPEAYPFRSPSYSINGLSPITFQKWAPYNTTFDIVKTVENLSAKEKGKGISTVSEKVVQTSKTKVIPEKSLYTGTKASVATYKKTTVPQSYKGPKRFSKEIRRNLVSLEEVSTQNGMLSEGQFTVLKRNFKGLGDLVRLGTAGDGSCLLHSILKNQAYSCPKNKAEIDETRQDIANHMILEYDAFSPANLKGLQDKLKTGYSTWLEADHLSVLSRYYCIGIFLITKNKFGDIVLLYPPEIPKDAKNFIVLYYMRGVHFEAVGLMPKHEPHVIQTTFSQKNRLFDELMTLLEGMNPKTHKPCIRKKSKSLSK
jgi:hypothetical protein